MARTLIKSTYLALPGTNGNYASTPNAAVLQITGDIDIRVRVAMDDWTPATNQFFLSKLPPGNRAYSLYVNGSSSLGKLDMDISLDGTNIISALSTVAPTITDGQILWVRVTRTSADGVVKFYTANGSIISPSGSDWTQLGANVSTTSGSLSNATSNLDIGSHNGGTSSPMAGKLYRAQIRNNVLDDGTGIQLDANFDNQTMVVSSFTEASTNAATITINSSGSPNARLVGRYTPATVRSLASVRSLATSTSLSILGTNGNYASTPDSVALSIQGDLTIDMFFSLSDWTTATQSIVSKMDSSVLRSYRFDVVAGGTPRLLYSTDGSTAINRSSTAAISYGANTAHWLRMSLDADNGASGHGVRFYTSPTETGLDWLQLGATVTNATTLTLADTVSVLEIGSNFLGTSQTMTGNVYQLKIYAADVRTGSDTPVFNASFTGRTLGSTSFTESSSNAATVTINQSGSTPAAFLGRVLSA